MLNLINTVSKENKVQLIIQLTLSSDETKEIDDLKIIDILSVSDASEVVLEKIESNLQGCLAELLWEGSEHKRIFMLQDGTQVYDFKSDGGLDKSSGKDATGSVLLRTFGVGDGDGGVITLTFRKV